MEEFRPLIGDSVVLTAVNNGEVKAEDFISAMGSVSLTAAGRKRFIEAYERRMSQEITHPIFGYRISYRRVLEVQARLLGRHLAGEIPEYPSFTTR
jgi:CRISPR-associated protein Cas1